MPRHALTLELLLIAVMIDVPAHAQTSWRAPVYGSQWPTNATNGLTSDGQPYIVALSDPPALLDSSGNFLGLLGESLVGVPPLRSTLAVAAAPNSHVYVINIFGFGKGMVVVMDRHGRLVRQFPLPPGFDLAHPGHDCRGIAVDVDGRVYLSSMDAGTISVISPEGQLLATWGSPGSGADQLNRPQRLKFDANGILFVADVGNYRIQRITPEGAFLPPLKTPAYALVDFDFDRAGNIYCLDEGYGVRVFDTSLQELGHWNDMGPNGTLNGARFITLDTFDNVYVANFGPTAYCIAEYEARTDYGPPNPAYSPKLVLTALPAPGTTHPCEAVRRQPLEEARTSGDLAGDDPAPPFYFVCLLVARGNGSYLAGLQCGLSYHNKPSDREPGRGIQIFEWQFCGDLQFPTPAGLPAGAPDWPGPGSGNLMTWDPIGNCQRLDMAVAGYFYLGAYSPSVFKLTPRPVDGAAKVAYCISSGEHLLVDDDLGYVTFSPGAVALGCNPVLAGCAEVVSVRPTTWSGIKLLFR